ncbi:MAG: histidinol-phosphatase HisJ family protein [Candidatus Cloacimonetes bacterium]|nr:histidinol-phosphatase HisJ family protein [Candidatus Cloacimonadota bacterium]
MLYDYHLHTEYSFDSCIKAEDLIRRAIELDYSEIAITEHVDLLPIELQAQGLPSLRDYVGNIHQLKAIYPKINVLCGIELGDFHRVRSFANDLIEGLNFDIILGSIHFLSDHTNVAIPLGHPLNISQVRDYYRQNLALVSDCNFDCLAHLGVYKRYYKAVPDESFALPIIKDIFSTMIARKIALEINYSTLRKGYPSFIPEISFIELYREMGGYLFSVGSDSHKLEHFHDNHASLPQNIPSFRQVLKGRINSNNNPQL